MRCDARRRAAVVLAMWTWITCACAQVHTSGTPAEGQPAARSSVDVVELSAADAQARLRPAR